MWSLPRLRTGDVDKFCEWIRNVWRRRCERGDRTRLEIFYDTHERWLTRLTLTVSRLLFLVHAIGHRYWLAVGHDAVVWRGWTGLAERDCGGQEQRRDDDAVVAEGAHL